MSSSADGITDSQGTEVARYAYDPYGNPPTSPAPGTLAERNPLRYRGYCLDAESGYYHMPARYYDPASARFVSVDPAAPSAGDPVSLNGYSYCFGDPVGLVDPDGRDVLYGDYYSDEQDPTGKLDANLPDHDGAGVGRPPSRKVWEANNTPAAIAAAQAERRQGTALDPGCTTPANRVDLAIDGFSAGVEFAQWYTLAGAGTVAVAGIWCPAAWAAEPVLFKLYLVLETMEVGLDVVSCAYDIYGIEK